MSRWSQQGSFERLNLKSALFTWKKFTSAEIASLTMNKYRDELRTCIQIYGDNWKAYYAVAEYAYWYEHGKLPEWACFVEAVDVVNGGAVFVHRDPDMAM
jgi:hypothetical protein